MCCARNTRGAVYITLALLVARRTTPESAPELPGLRSWHAAELPGGYRANVYLIAVYGLGEVRLDLIAPLAHRLFAECKSALRVRPRIIRIHCMSFAKIGGI